MHRDLVIAGPGTATTSAFSLLAAASFDQLLRTARLILRDTSLAADAVRTRCFLPGSTFERFAIRIASTPGSADCSFTPAIERRSECAVAEPWRWR